MEACDHGLEFEADVRALSITIRRDAVFASNPGLGPTGMNAMATWGTVQALNLRSMATTGGFRGRADGQLKTRVRRAASSLG